MKLRHSEWAREDAEKSNQMLQREMESFFNHGKLDCWGKRCQSAEVKEWAVPLAARLPSHGLCSWTWASVGLQNQHRLEAAVPTPHQEPEPHRGWSCSGSGGCSHRAGCGRHQSGQSRGRQNRWHLEYK